MSAPTHPFTSQQVSLIVGGKCYRCGGDVSDIGLTCRDCMFLPMPFLNAPWADDALCAQTDPEVFFPRKGESSQDAKAVCGRCPVAAECLTYALETGATDGVWGGLSAKERDALRRRGAA